MHLYKKTVFHRGISREKNTVNHRHHVQYGMSTAGPPHFRVSWKPLVEIKTVST